jgi:DNA-binding MarR family transcriptional regulator
VQTASADTELAARLRDALARTGRRLRQEAGTGLSPSLLMALASIEREGPLTPSELAVRERIQRPTVTRILARLEEGGLVSRAPDPADRRSSLVSATAAGRALLAESRTRKDAFLSARLDELSPEDRATLARAAVLLERMLAEPAA